MFPKYDLSLVCFCLGVAASTAIREEKCQCITLLDQLAEREGIIQELDIQCASLSRRDFESMVQIALE